MKKFRLGNFQQGSISSGAYVYRLLKKYGRDMPDPSIAFKESRRFKKMHNRSKDFIDDYIENAVVPNSSSWT